MSGWQVLYWPDTTAVMAVTGADSESDVMPGWVFVPYEEGVQSPMPVEDPRFFLVPEQDKKRVLMREACSNEITRSSFQSSALGDLYNYDCRIVDQVNLLTRLSLTKENSSEEPLWASDGTRFQWIPHDSSEIIQVIEDMNEHIKQAQIKLASKLAAIDAATTRSEMDAIIW